MRRANDLGGQAARTRPVFKMWSSLLVVTFLFGLAIGRDNNIDGEDPGTRLTKSSVVFDRTEERSFAKNRIGKSNRIFDFVKSNFDYRDNVMVMSPPLKVTLNKSPQKNESLFRISKTLKKNSENTSSKLFRGLDILRASFDPRDSVMVMSPPLKVTLNNSPQKNDSLFRVSRNGDKNNSKEGNYKRGASAADREVKNVANLVGEEKSFGRANDSSKRKKRETSVLNDNRTTQQLSANHRYYTDLRNDDSVRDSDEKQKGSSQVSPTPTPSSSRYRQNRWPRELISYLFVPVMFILGYAPLALWALKMLVYKGLILSKVAFLAAIYMGLRTLIFGTPVSAVKYYNYGYENDQFNHLVDPAWQTA